MSEERFRFGEPDCKCLCLGGNCNNSIYILWIDQAEYYLVCLECYDKEKHKQWSGFTVVMDFALRREKVAKEADETKVCEFCKRKVRFD